MTVLSKSQLSVRTSLYRVLDNLINCCKGMNRDLPTITLNSAQFQTFKDFNTKDSDGFYHYRGIPVKGVGH